MKKPLLSSLFFMSLLTLTGCFPDASIYSDSPFGKNCFMADYFSNGNIEIELTRTTPLPTNIAFGIDDSGPLVGTCQMNNDGINNSFFISDDHKQAILSIHRTAFSNIDSTRLFDLTLYSQASCEGDSPVLEKTYSDIQIKTVRVQLGGGDPGCPTSTIDELRAKIVDEN